MSIIRSITSVTGSSSFRKTARSRTGRKSKLLAGGLFYSEELDFENQRGVRRNLPLRVFAVGEVGGDKQLPFGADFHFLQRFHPAFNHPIYREHRRFVPRVRAVELRTVNQSSAIVHFDRVGFFRSWA